MTCRPPPSLRNALSQADVIAPGRHTDPESDGICADAHHIAGGTSNHIPDAHGIPHAVDVDDDQFAGYDAGYWAEQVRLRIKAGDEIGHVVTEIISERRFTSARHDWEWVPYGGEDPHESHAHYSIARTAFAEHWDGEWWTPADGGLSMDAAEKIIETVGKYDQDTRKFLAAVAKDEAEAQGQKTRRVTLDYLDALRIELGVDQVKVVSHLSDETKRILAKVD